MVGRPVLLDVGYQAAQAGQAMLNAEHLTVTETSGVTSLSDISFSVHQGEILGIAGVSGNGQSELLEVLAGIRKITSGTVQIGDEKLLRNNRHLLQKSNVLDWPMCLKIDMLWA